MKKLYEKPRSAGIQCALAIALAAACGSAAQAATCADAPLVLGAGETLDCSTTDPDLTINTNGAGESAIQVSGFGSELTLGGTTTLDTSGANAEGLAVSGGGVVIAKPGPISITTAGDGAVGIHVQDGGSDVTLGGVNINPPSSGSARVGLGGNVVISTAGSGAHGVVVDGGASADTTVGTFGTITTQAADADGISVTSSGAVTVSSNSGGWIRSGGVGIRASGETSATIIQSGWINAGGTGILASTNPAGTTLIRNDRGIITSQYVHGIDVSGALGANTITNTGNITATFNPTPGIDGTYAIYGGGGQETVTLDGGTIQGNIHLGDGDDTLTANSGAVVGGIYMGGSSDTATLNAGADLSGVAALDGEGPAQTDAVTPDPRGTNTLTLNNTLTGSTTGAGVGVAGNALVANWDQVNIGSDGTTSRLALTGGLNDGRGGGSLGVMRIFPTGTLALAAGIPSATVDYDVSNMGTIDLTQGSATPTGVLTITGNYDLGKEISSRLLVKSTWNNPDEQQNDLLHILGNAEGNTVVSVPGGIIGNVTQGDVIKNGELNAPVVTVEGTDTGTNAAGLTFEGTADTTNAGQAQLVKVGKSYYWTLQARGPDDGTPILVPGTPGYVQMPRINREMGFEQLGTLHERVGEQQTWAWDDCGTMCAEYRRLAQAGSRPHPIWGRMRFGTLKEQGEDRLGYKSNSGFIQFGTDVDVSTDEARNHRHIGITASYGHGEHDFYDKYRAENGVVTDNKHTGAGTTDMFSLGAYGTWYRANGTYVDLVGNASFIRNQYKSASGNASQNGYGLGASVEVGRPWQLGSSNWQIEPQAQLSYQYVHLGDFDDNVRSVDGQSGGTLRGRLGTRLAWNADNGKQHTSTFYVALNVLHDLTGNDAKANIGNDRITEQYARTWGEVSVGGQVALGKSTYLFGDARYDRSIGSYSNDVFRGSGIAREGYSGRVGVRYSW